MDELIGLKKTHKNVTKFVIAITFFFPFLGVANFGTILLVILCAFK